MTTPSREVPVPKPPTTVLHPSICVTPPPHTIIRKISTLSPVGKTQSIKTDHTPPRGISYPHPSHTISNVPGTTVVVTPTKHRPTPSKFFIL